MGTSERKDHSGQIPKYIAVNIIQRYTPANDAEDQDQGITWNSDQNRRKEEAKEHTEQQQKKSSKQLGRHTLELIGR